MDPMRKQFAADAALPVELVLRHTKNLQAELPDHLHDWLEIIYVHGGGGSFFINHTFYEMQAGDLYLIPGNTIHKTMPHSDEPLTSSVVFFSGQYVQASSIGMDGYSFLQCFVSARAKRSYRLELLPEERARLEEMFDEMQKELAAREPGYKQAILLQLQTLLLRLNRKITPGAANAPSNGSRPGWLQNALNEIDGRLGEEIGLASLASRASVSPSYFSRMFKQHTGMNVTEYVIAKRIMHAKELLADTDRTVAEIAAACGFESLPHFYRIFKKIAGDTPAHYKRLQ
ncbi:AraC-like ligand binding domain-containing protein [Paenibacillus sp. UNC496MF]|uniref:AraC family transcriptional regulator n=1 Tax=Paenibacillus sp. UNC496MF TaxID=1502753 RepID=UPI0008E117F9|nr:AraC family transcriptional regulator [Paenibacillus sp. UNC496MF]SFJ86337.1 AraC-like ligand binding domain-containing protein [Paenibacillus sp. UNC496MF]